MSKEKKKETMRRKVIVGKTYIVDEFGRREFISLITLNFEKYEESDYFVTIIFS
jgi:hypothetical protein